MWRDELQRPVRRPEPDARSVRACSERVPRWPLLGALTAYASTEHQPFPRYGGWHAPQRPCPRRVQPYQPAMTTSAGEALLARSGSQAERLAVAHESEGHGQAHKAAGPAPGSHRRGGTSACHRRSPDCWPPWPLPASWSRAVRRPARHPPLLGTRTRPPQAHRLGRPPSRQRNQPSRRRNRTSRTSTPGNRTGTRRLASRRRPAHPRRRRRPARPRRSRPIRSRRVTAETRMLITTAARAMVTATSRPRPGTRTGSRPADPA